MTQAIRDLFSRPLIIGASISAGYGTTNGGPSEVFARMINPDTKIKNLAFNGATSINSTSGLDLKNHSASVVMALDLFFWDAIRNQVGTSFETNTKRFFNHLHEHEMPAIIGKLPLIDLPLGPFAEVVKNNAKKVNALLEDICTIDRNFLVYDPLECVLQMNDHHFSDGLHLTNEGNHYCAQYLANSGLYYQLRPRKDKSLQSPQI